MTFTLNPIQGIIEAVGAVATSLITTDKERLAFQLEEDKLDVQLMEGQVEVNKVEAASTNWFVAGWRPALGWVGAAGFAYQFLLYPVLTWLWAFLQAIGWVAQGLPTPPMLDTGALWVLVSGMLGLVSARSVDKIKGVARG